jgi:hypothetical protein
MDLVVLGHRSLSSRRRSGSRRVCRPSLHLHRLPSLTPCHSYVFYKFQISLHDGDARKSTQSRTIPTYLALFIFGFLYQLALVWDALRLKNTIQVIGLCLYNLGLLIYAVVQYDQIDRAVQALNQKNEIGAGFGHDVKPFLVAVPCVLALGTLAFSFVAWKLYDEFAWTIYKHISADLRLKRRFLVYQVFCVHIVILLNTH